MSSSAGRPFVELIVPVYNTDETYLRECLASIDLDDERVHVTLVDDGSELVCARLLDQMAEQAPALISVVHKENGGQSSARLAGLEASDSEYVTFLDSDDWLDWGAFSQVLDLAAEHAPKVLSFEYSESNDRETVSGVKGHVGRCVERDAREHVVGAPSLCTVLYRRDAIAREDFCIGPRMGEDLATAVPIALRAGTVLSTDLDAYRYRRNDQSVTGTPSMSSLTDVMDSFDHLERRCAALSCDCHDVVEWLTILHVLYHGGVRCIAWFGPDAQIKRQLFGYMRQHYPRWRANPYLRRQPVCKTPSFILVTRGFWRAYSLIRRS